MSLEFKFGTYVKTTWYQIQMQKFYTMNRTLYMNILEHRDEANVPLQQVQHAVIGRWATAELGFQCPPVLHGQIGRPAPLAPASCAASSAGPWTPA